MKLKAAHKVATGIVTLFAIVGSLWAAWGVFAERNAWAEDSIRTFKQLHSKITDLQIQDLKTKIEKYLAIEKVRQLENYEIVERDFAQKKLDFYHAEREKALTEEKLRR